MSQRQPALALVGGPAPAVSPPSPPCVAVTTTDVTVYGCTPDEADLFRELAPGLGVRPTLTDEPLHEANAELARGSRCVSVDHRTEVAAGTLQALRRVGVEHVVTRSIGYDHIDVAYARSIGLSVGNAVYAPDGVADYTLMLILMLVRDARRVVRRADAHDYRLSTTRHRELRDLTVGVVGTGRIGSAVVDRLRAFGCRTVAYDRRPRTNVEHLGLDELLHVSDVVTLHTPLTPDTHHLLDRNRLGRMKPGALLVNTARGGLVDTEALVRALESGRLGGAALDVVEGEERLFYADHRATPLAGEPLLHLQGMANVLVSPHTAYYTDRALTETVEQTLIGCLTFENRARRA